MTAPSMEVRRIAVGTTHLNVASVGAGPAVLLLHGWPHTRQVWRNVMPTLAARHRVIAPDLRGIGGSDREAGGYDAASIAADLLGLLDALDVPTTSVVALDAGVTPAAMLALTNPSRVSRLALMEGLLPGLPSPFDSGADPRWWFGFHAVPGLAERVLADHHAPYLDHFYDTGTLGRGIPGPIRDEFITAYAGSDSLRCGFEYYRSTPINAQQILDATADLRLTMTTLAIGAATVGNSLHRQLIPVADDLSSHLIEDCGHIIPLDRPDAFVAVLSPFLR